MDEEYGRRLSRGDHEKMEFVVQPRLQINLSLLLMASCSGRQWPEATRIHAVLEATFD